jgi:HD superfamily phosphodiesterase
MNLTVIIESAELQFRQVLEEYFISVYGEKYLSSHGIDHHRRVWNYAKEILTLPYNNHKFKDIRLPAKLIIACYMHDIGMSIETGIRHGMQSKDLCLKFLRNNQFPEADFTDVLDAIEHHDQKEYEGDKTVSDILNILSVSDDLDAFGFAGIYRYSEIYLTRGGDPATIGYQICENAVKRFGNFKSKYESSGEFFQKHKSRYEILENFFTRYNNQIKTYKFGSGHPYGYPGVIEVLMNMIIDNREENGFIEEPEKYSYDKTMFWYFCGLNSELF